MIDVRVENGPQLRRALKQTENGFQDLKDANAKVATFVADRSKPYARRQTGRMAGSVKGNRAAGRAVVTSRLIYAPVQYWGWPGHSISPDPWIQDAADATQEQWLGMYTDDLQHVIDTNMGSVR